MRTDIQLADVQFAATQGLNHLRLKASYSLDRPLGKPDKVSVIITDACAARCTMCDIWKLQAHNELDVDEWKRVLDDLRSWLGPFFIVISGGEPFQKRGMFDILAHCRDIGIKIVRGQADPGESFAIGKQERLVIHRDLRGLCRIAAFVCTGSA